MIDAHKTAEEIANEYAYAIEAAGDAWAAAWAAAWASAIASDQAAADAAQAVAKAAREIAASVSGYIAEPRLSELANDIEAALIAAERGGMERAEAEVKRLWREAPNVRTKSALTSFEQNLIGPGCARAIAAIRALGNGPEGEPT